jgi:hypothetical protein
MKNALEYSKMLEGAGLTRAQAEAHLKVMEQAMEEGMASKRDVMDSKNELKGDITELKGEISELRGEVVHLEAYMRSEFISVRKDMETLEYKITTKLGVIVTVAMTGLATFFKFFI